MLKKELMKFFTYFIVICTLIYCSENPSKSEEEIGATKTNDFLVDSLATIQTVALYQNLKEFAKNKVLFGHHETTAYGIDWKDNGFGDKSDVKEVCGDFPAVYGWDLGDIQLSENLVGVKFTTTRRLITQAYERGGINTISMHLDNPVTRGDAWDNSTAVTNILPNGSHNSFYLKTLDLIADFLLTLKGAGGEYIPIIFRPYHEHNHTWAWWGKSATSESEYIQLWKMTIEYLRDTHKIHHLIYAISPQDISSQEEYLYAYPGDEYVDILGMDVYELYKAQNIDKFINGLEIVSNLAESKNKISALTEVGIENVTISNWWTEYLLKGLSENSSTLRTAWALVWRNKDKNHHFAPYPGHSSADNFIRFYNSELTIFESDLIDTYK